MSIRPNPAGQDRNISWGHLGNFKKYKNVAAKDEEKTLEQRKKEIFEKMKPYNSEDYIYKAAFVVGGAGVYETPIPSPTPTPSITPSPTPTPTPSITPTQTLTPTPTPSTPAFDSDAALYLADVLSTGGTLDATISAATNTLFTSLKSNNLYDKLDYFYPVVGGTDASHSIMGKRVSGTTYDITWGGAMTHSVSGMTGVGTSGSYGELHIPNNSTILGNRSWSLYSFIQNTSNGYDLSCIENGIIVGYGGSNTWYGMMDQTNYDPMTAATTTGMYISSETTLNNQRNFKNGVNTGNFTRTSYKSPTLSFIIGGKNNTGAPYTEFPSRGYNWIGIGKGLSDSEANTLSTIINTFQTTLGRNTY